MILIKCHMVDSLHFTQDIKNWYDNVEENSNLRHIISNTNRFGSQIIYEVSAINHITRMHYIICVA